MVGTEYKGQCIKYRTIRFCDRTRIIGWLACRMLSVVWRGAEDGCAVLQFLPKKEEGVVEGWFGQDAPAPCPWVFT
jgi:hypothetical protein